MYEIIDTHTGYVVGKAKTLRSALRTIDRRDNAYGAYRYTWRKVDAGIPMRNMRDLDKVMDW